MRNRWLAGAGVLVVALATAACGSSPGGSTTSASASSAAATSAVASAAATSASPVLPTATLAGVKEGDPVKQCQVFTGTASLPATKTLVLGMHNLDNSDPNRYFETAENWEYPTELTTWKGAQYFGTGNSSVGQRFRLELLIVDVTTVQKAVQQAPDKGWYGPANPAGSSVAAHVTLKRVSGDGPPECS